MIKAAEGSHSPVRQRRFQASELLREAKGVPSASEDDKAYLNWGKDGCGPVIQSASPVGGVVPALLGGPSHASRAGICHAPRTHGGHRGGAASRARTMPSSAAGLLADTARRSHIAGRPYPAIPDPFDSAQVQGLPASCRPAPRPQTKCDLLCSGSAKGSLPPFERPKLTPPTRTPATKSRVVKVPTLLRSQGARSCTPP
mmetsp:Transcript_19739/g.52392  ORF Transcript_19739/g.52392 Transcript_19739/m.52392 type:complete len:200 (-) Transcript_19739:938-1537(-)